MRKLLKEYNFDFEHEYYDLIIKSVVNGQFEQAKNQFKAMPKKFKITFVVQITIYFYGCAELTDDNKIMFIELL